MFVEIVKYNVDVLFIVGKNLFFIVISNDEIVLLGVVFEDVMLWDECIEEIVSSVVFMEEVV